MELPAATQRVVEAARDLGLDIDIHLFPDGTKTSQDAADAVDCELSAIAKSLVFMVDDRPVVAFLSGDTKLDTARLAEEMGGEKARRASLDECRHHTGFAAGGTPPFGHAEPVTILADRALERHTDVWSAGGTPTTVFPIRLDDLVRVTSARWVDISVPI